MFRKVVAAVEREISERAYGPMQQAGEDHFKKASEGIRLQRLSSQRQTL
jgi:hypothetical protein